MNVMKRSFHVLLGICMLAVISISLIGGCAVKKVPVPQPEPQKQSPQVQTPSNADRKPADFLPLTKGSTWKYRGEGNEYASFTREVVYVLNSRAQIKEDNGGTVSSSVFETTNEQITLIFFQGETYHNENFLNREPNEKAVLLKAPLMVGTKWDYRNGTREITDVNAAVDTPAGKYENCIAVKISSPDSTLFEYYKEGVGLVKREFGAGENRIISTLEKVQINPK